MNRERTQYFSDLRNIQRNWPFPVVFYRKVANLPIPVRYSFTQEVFLGGIFMAEMQARFTMTSI